MFSKSKKIISFIISFVMLFSFGSMSFASNEVGDENMKIIEETKEFKKYEIVTPDGETEYVIENITDDQNRSFEIIGNDYSAFVEEDGDKINVFDEKHDLIEEISIDGQEVEGTGEDLSLNPLGENSFVKARAYYPTAWRLNGSYKGSRSGDLANFGVLFTILTILVGGSTGAGLGLAYAAYGAVSRNIYFKKKVYIRITSPKSWQFKNIVSIYKHSNYTGFMKTTTTYTNGYGS